MREEFCKSLEDMCTDWMGTTRDFKIQFECPKPGCNKRFPLDVCYGSEIYIHCRMHDINLNEMREMFGTCPLLCYGFVSFDLSKEV